MQREFFCNTIKYVKTCVRAQISTTQKNIMTLNSNPKNSINQDTTHKKKKKKKKKTKEKKDPKD